MKQWMFSIKAAVLCAAIVLAPACGNQGQGLPQIEGVKGPIFNVVDGKILVTMKFTNMTGIDAGAKFPLGIVDNSLKESAIEFAPNMEDGGMMLSLYLDKTDLENMDVAVGSGNTLPDGRPVPGIPGGELQNSVRIDAEFKVSGKNMKPSFFLHKKFLGLWMPFGFETAGISGYWNVFVQQKNVAFLGIVGNDTEGRKAGGLVMLRLEALKTKRLQKLLEISERNPHLVY